MLLLVLVVLFVVLPIAELAVIIQVADGIGIGETILLLIAVSAVGGWLCKREGLGVLRRIQASLDRHELPARDLADGGLILFAGALLVTPGFITDVLGVLLLLPPTRAMFRVLLLAGLGRRARLVTVVSDRVRGPGRPPAGPGQGVIDTTGSDEL